MRRLSLGFLAVALLGTGCTAIPINLPAADSGAEYSDGRGGGLADAGAPDSPWQVGSPDAGARSDGTGYLDGDARPDGWVPDACLGDAGSDAVCPLPSDAGPPTDSTTDAVSDDGSLTDGGGRNDDGSTPGPDGGASDS